MRVRFSKKFKKQFDKADRKIQLAFEQRLRLFLADQSIPQLHDHQLSGQLSSYRIINISGDWRALYSITEEGGAKVCVFEMMGTHSQLYR